MRPAFFDDMSWRMAEVYGAVTDRILVNLARHFPLVHSTGQMRGSFEYQVRMLAQLGQVRRETVDIILKSLSGADEALRASLEAAIMDALKNEEPKLRKAAEQGLLPGAPVTVPEVTPNQMQAFRAYYRQSADKLNLVNTVMLESTENAYRSTVADAAARIERTQGILNEATGEVVTGVSSWNTAMHDAVQKMVANGLTGFIDHGGHRWSPEAYVAMDVRTTMFNTARAATWERAEQYGADLYQVSSHNGARPLCYPWQGKVISRSDQPGVVEDIEGTRVEVIPQSQTSYGEAAGLFGINCRHYPMTFIPGFSTLRGQPQDPEENAKAYAQSQEQRRLERKLREERRDLAVMKAQGADPEAIRAQRERVNRASDRIDEFCDQTGLPRRKNREYTPINATWPDSGDIPPRTGGSDPNGPGMPPVQVHLGGDDIPPMGQAGQAVRGLSSGGAFGDAPEHAPPEFVRQVLDDEDRSVVLSQYEETIREAPVEHAYVITKDGRLYHCTGTENRVLPDDLGDDLIGADVTHNHTAVPENEHSFSDDDLKLFRGYRLRSLRGVESSLTYQVSSVDLRVDEATEDWTNEMNYRHSAVIREAHKYGFGYRRWQYEKG